ncbi:MAG: hypothetical protein GEU83_04405 [Pseudonocardiaceae bacterium]|nr:hypothetical protein [Pseudonocardiaceae bacterium]
MHRSDPAGAAESSDGSLPPDPSAGRESVVGADPAAGSDSAEVDPAEVELAEVELAQWEQQLAELLAFLRRRVTGDYDIDEFGFDAELTDHMLLPMLRPLYRSWFRVQTIGMHRVPDTGGALVVANHSGTLPLDALMTTVALREDHPAGRHLRMLGADLVFSTPMLGSVARKAGHTLACNPDAERLLNSGELAGVWPEGFKGIGKNYRDRYKLQRFGRGGFVSAALRTGTPIIPCSIVGAEEIYPMLGDIKPLARLLGAPYFPVTPLFPWFGPLGMIPLPSKWYIEFGEPIYTDSYEPGAAEDPMLVFNLTDQVRETIQQTLYRLLTQRRNPFFG